MRLSGGGVALLAVVAAAFITGVRAAPPPAAPSAESDPVGGLHRLTEAQYKNAIADIFGEDIEVSGRIRRSAMSPTDLVEYERMARAIATQVVDARHRAALVACAPQDATLPDDSCAATFFRRTGRLMFRRPLSAEDVQNQVTAAREATKITRDFYVGMAASLATMLVSPSFLFDIDVLERDPATPGRQRLDAYSKASRLSLFLWHTTPDATLLEAAARGELHTAPGLTRQIDRLLGSPRIDAGAKAFLSDASGDMDGCELKGAGSYEQAIRNFPALPACLTRKAAEYALRRPLRDDETAWVTDLTSRFALGGYQLPGLLREVATSPVFFRVTESKAPAQKK